MQHLKSCTVKSYITIFYPEILFLSNSDSRNKMSQITFPFVFHFCKIMTSSIFIWTYWIYGSNVLKYHKMNLSAVWIKNWFIYQIALIFYKLDIRWSGREFHFLHYLLTGLGSDGYKRDFFWDWCLFYPPFVSFLFTFQDSLSQIDGNLAFFSGLTSYNKDICSRHLN